MALFNASGGQYACNPKHILLKLREKAPGLKAYFVVSEKHSPADSFPDYARTVRYGSIRHGILECRCNIRVTNAVFSTSFYGFQSLSPFSANMLMRKKLIISTWHGTPLKALGFDLAGMFAGFPGIGILSDFILAGCRHTAKVLSTCWSREPFPVSLTGTPRNDILVNGNADVAALKEKLKLPKDKKIFLFAPTYRESGEGAKNNILQMEALDIPCVLDALSKRFGGEWVFVFRVHQHVLLKMREARVEAPNAIDGNIGDDMAEYLACADILMTDYSGSLFDFALTRRPCFLFALDRERYEKEERGVYFDIGALPFPFADSCDALIANIKAFDEAAYKAGVEKFLADIGNVEDGRAAERVADCILHYIETGEKRLETAMGVDVR